MTRQYQVKWEADVEASSPRDAALKARRQQQWPRPNYWSGVFDVTTPDGHCTRVDLDETEKSQLVVERTLVLNTAHIGQRAIQAFRDALSNTFTYESLHVYRTALDDTFDILVPEHGATPFHSLFAAARTAGCKWVRISPKAPVEPSIPKFLWG